MSKYNFPRARNLKQDSELNWKLESVAAGMRHHMGITVECEEILLNCKIDIVRDISHIEQQLMFNLIFFLSAK